MHFSNLSLLHSLSGEDVGQNILGNSWFSVETAITVALQSCECVTTCVFFFLKGMTSRRSSSSWSVSAPVWGQPHHKCFFSCTENGGGYRTLCSCLPSLETELAIEWVWVKVRDTDAAKIEVSSLESAIGLSISRGQAVEYAVPCA